MFKLTRNPLIISIALTLAASLDVFGQVAIPPASSISTVAGTSLIGLAGDGGLATSAHLGTVPSVAVDAAGNLYISDSDNNRVRKVDVNTGVITTVAGTGDAGRFSANGNWGDGGLAVNAVVNRPIGIATDSVGNLYITDADNRIVRKVTVKTGVITTVAGMVGYPNGSSNSATNFSLKQPTGVAVDASGDIYIADAAANIVYKVTATTGLIAAIAGNGTAGYSGDGEFGTSAELSSPTSIAVDDSGNVYIADYENEVIRKVDASSGNISTFAGTGEVGHTGDGGLATKATLNLPEYLAVDNAGNVYFDDYQDNVVRKITVSTGIISTVAGDAKSGAAGFSGDGGPATGALLYHPFGVALDASGNLYFADSHNYRIRVVGSGLGSDSTYFVKVSSSDSKPTMDEVVTLSATIANGQGSPATTGTVSWKIGNKTVGQSAVDSNGVATYVATLSMGGNQVITAQYSGVKPSAGTMELQVSGFSLTAPTTVASVPAAQAARFTFNASSFYGYSGSVDLACSGMPAPGGCSLSSNSIGFNNSITSTPITLTVATETATSAKVESKSANGFALALLCPFVLLGIRNKRFRNSLIAAVLLVSGALMTAGLTGCSASSNGTAKVTTQVNTVAAGTYTVTVVATSGSRTISVPFTVTVQ